MEFGYPLRLKSKYEEDGVIWLNYQTKILGTGCIFRIPTTVENDTARILLRTLDRGLINQSP